MQKANYGSVSGMDLLRHLYLHLWVCDLIEHE